MSSSQEITGASKDIGTVAAEVFPHQGCSLRLAACGRAALGSFAGRLRSGHGATIQVHPVDPRDLRESAALAAAVPGLDILVDDVGGIPTD